YDSSFAHPAHGIIGIQMGSLIVERSTFSAAPEDVGENNGTLYGITVSVDASLTATNNTFRGLYEGIASISNICGSLSNNLFERTTYPMNISNAIPLLSENRFVDNTFNAARLSEGITKTCGERTTHTTFVVNGQLTVRPNASLSIGTGSVFKFGPDVGSMMVVSGGFAVQGTEQEPAVFTSVHDTEYGGTTYTDSAQAPSAGDWTGVRITGAPAAIDHALFRYGGRVYFGLGHYESSILEVTNATVSVSASTIEYSMYIGMRILNADVVLDGTVFQHNNVTTYFSYGKGLSVGSSTALITRSSFHDNSVGIRVDDGTSVVTVDDETKTNSTDTSYPTDLLH
ncbi:MAG: hypothetical protein AAB899_01235, partial [Patescibacteria group bacterium]